MFGSIHLCSSLLDKITVSILGYTKTVVMVLENFQVKGDCLTLLYLIILF